MILISRQISPRFSTSFWLPRLWDLATILLEILPRFSVSSWPPRLWDLGECLAAKILRSWLESRPEILRSHQVLGENLNEIVRSRRDLGEILGKFLAAEVLRSRRESRWVLGRRDFEISAISPAKNPPRFEIRSNFAGEVVVWEVTFTVIITMEDYFLFADCKICFTVNSMDTLYCTVQHLLTVFIRYTLSTVTSAFSSFQRWQLDYPWWTAME